MYPSDLSFTSLTRTETPELTLNLKLVPLVFHSGGASCFPLFHLVLTDASVLISPLDCTPPEGRGHYFIHLCIIHSGVQCVPNKHVWMLEDEHQVLLTYPIPSTVP